jgi:hypothetical protein
MQRSEQYFTASQFFAQDLRQAIGRPQCWHGFSGRFGLLAMIVNLGMPAWTSLSCLRAGLCRASRMAACNFTAVRRPQHGDGWEFQYRSPFENAILIFRNKYP